MRKTKKTPTKIGSKKKAKKVAKKAVKKKKVTKKKVTKKATPKIPKGWISTSEFCAETGSSPTAIYYACNRGRITSYRKFGGKGRYFDPVAAKKEWEENADTAQRERNYKKKEDFDPGSHDKYIEQKQKEILKFAEIDYDKIPAQEAERREKVYKAKLAELKYLEQSGKLIEIEVVKATWFELVRKVRDGLMTLPARLAPELAAETSSHKLEMRLRKELNENLEKLVDENVS